MDREDIEKRYDHLINDFSEVNRLQLLDMILTMTPAMIEQEILLVEEYSKQVLDEYKQRLKVYTWLLGAMKTCPKRKLKQKR